MKWTYKLFHKCILIDVPRIQYVWYNNDSSRTMCVRQTYAYLILQFFQTHVHAVASISPLKWKILERNVKTIHKPALLCFLNQQIHLKDTPRRILIVLTKIMTSYISSDFWIRQVKRLYIGFIKLKKPYNYLKYIQKTSI